MRNILFIFLCYFSLQIYAQEPQLAFQYFRNGDYEKSASIYKVLHEKHSYNTTYLNYLIDCYHQLENYNEITRIVNKQLEKYPKYNLIHNTIHNLLYYVYTDTHIINTDINIIRL